MKIMVRTSPERIKAMIKNVRKKMQAVPKSLIRNKAPTQTAEKPINSVRFLVVCRRARVEVPTRIKAILTNSEG